MLGLKSEVVLDLSSVSHLLDLSNLFSSYFVAEQAVQNTEDIWFINYYSAHCGHCHELAPVVSDGILFLGYKCVNFTFFMAAIHASC